MSDTNRYTGTITITPPLTAVELRGAPETRDARFRIEETTADTEFGRSILCVGVGIESNCDGMGGRLFDHDVQALVGYVGTLDGPREFAGHIEVEWDPGYGLTPPSRFTVRGGRVVEVKARIVWPDEADGA